MRNPAFITKHIKQKSCYVKIIIFSYTKLPIKNDSVIILKLKLKSSASYLLMVYLMIGQKN